MGALKVCGGRGRAGPGGARPGRGVAGREGARNRRRMLLGDHPGAVRVPSAAGAGELPPRPPARSHCAAGFRGAGVPGSTSATSCRVPRLSQPGCCASGLRLSRGALRACLPGGVPWAGICGRDLRLGPAAADS